MDEDLDREVERDIRDFNGHLKKGGEFLAGYQAELKTCIEIIARISERWEVIVHSDAPRSVRKRAKKIIHCLQDMGTLFKKNTQVCDTFLSTIQSGITVFDGKRGG